ncbi:helix-turn-helix domain-containing protein [Oerskovia jenensis]|uniref:DNA-binding phage protein n=1 Tax=Oerskovia jenensis TaxID=162169 RepID=A0ABS2LEX0_9CELL|nr:helix-turn-helix transcriptional regulator [Oerskovia jenensis]MBM7478958.1 DNA-binding phage protein [Oerskovia jenensis]
MPRRSQEYRTPRDWLAEGDWPEGTFTADAPTAVAYAVEIARRLGCSLEGQTKTSLARQAGLERTTIYDLLAGRTWPDAVTLAKLEEALETRLWPDHPVPPLRS